MQTGHPDDQTLSAYVDQRGTAGEPSFVEAHTAACPECRARVAQIQATAELLTRYGSVEPPRPLRISTATRRPAVYRANRWLPSLSLAASILLFFGILSSLRFVSAGSGQASAVASAPQTAAKSSAASAAPAAAARSQAQPAAPGVAAGAVPRLVGTPVERGASTPSPSRPLAAAGRVQTARGGLNVWQVVALAISAILFLVGLVGFVAARRDVAPPLPRDSPRRSSQTPHAT